MVEVMVDGEAGVVLMHVQGTPRTMQADPRYDDVVGEVSEYLAGRAKSLQEAGLSHGHIAIDPGIGFGKTFRHNLDLIDGIGDIAALGFPVVLGTSRKTFLGAITGIEAPLGRDGATAVTTALGFERGARVFRVHEVPGSRVALSVAAAIVAGQQWDGWQQDSNPGGSPG
jgi:dihydropteroate synthase